MASVRGFKPVAEDAVDASDTAEQIPAAAI